MAATERSKHACANAFGVRWLDAALVFERSGANEPAAAFNHPRLFERESCVEPQHSTTIFAYLRDFRAWHCKKPKRRLNQKEHDNRRH
jgi:hypothetical protein